MVKSTRRRLKDQLRHCNWPRQSLSCNCCQRLERDISITMSKRVEINIPVQAETEAISWAVPQLVSHNIHKTIVESDAKVCIEAMLESSSRPPWRIEVLTADTLVFSS